MKRSVKEFRDLFRRPPVQRLYLFMLQISLMVAAPFPTGRLVIAILLAKPVIWRLVKKYRVDEADPPEHESVLSRNVR